MAKQKTNTTPTTKAVTLEWVPFGDLVFLENNPRSRTDEGKRKMASDIEADPSFYENRPTLVNLVNGEYRVYGGDLRAHAAHDVLGWPLIPCNVEADVPPELMRSRAILDNTHRETWDADKLSEWGYEPEELEEMGVWLADDSDGGEGGGEINAEGSEPREPGNGKDLGGGQLRARFGVPPFSVLDTRQGYWQERKRHWLSLGIKSELGRGGGDDVQSSGVGSAKTFKNQSGLTRIMAR